MAAATDTVLSGYRALTEGCGLVDRSERGKLALTGPDAKTFLQGQVTNDVEGLEPGRGCYAALLTPKGKMLGDLRVLDLGDELLLDTERSALQELFNMIRRFKLGSELELRKRTLEMGLLSLIGPEARTVAGAEGLGRAEHDNLRAELAGRPVVLVATDLGVDVFTQVADTDAVREALDAPVVAEEIAEIVRVESGRPRYGVDLDDGVIPQEAGLNERAVSFTKGCYVGQETVARLHYRGKPNRHLRGLRLSDPAERGTDILAGEKVVGLFQGRMEFGPRALGNRSILGDARSPKMQSVLNLKVKYRESFRPFAPSVLRERVADWFEIDHDSPYMLLVADVVERRRKEMTPEQKAMFGIQKLNVPRSDIPAVTHVDYSARIQTVHQDTNPRYHALLSSFERLTGCPVIVNTSFNVRGEPIVCTPEDAFRCFMGTEIEVLAVGNCYLRKEAQDQGLRKNYEQAFELD